MGLQYPSAIRFPIWGSVVPYNYFFLPFNLERKGKKK